MSNIAIIPIGGMGFRMNNNIPKQFMEINNKPLYIYTLERFQNNSSIDKIIIACLKGYEEQVKNDCNNYSINKVDSIVIGGKTQMESIMSCLKNNKFDKEDKIIVHVGNRPNLSNDLIKKVINKYDEIGPLTTIVPEIEVLVNKNTNEIIPRDDVIRIQTPQVYKYKDLIEIIENNMVDASTLCDLFLKLGKSISYVDGELLNFKITYPEDLELFEKIVNNI